MNQKFYDAHVLGNGCPNPDRQMSRSLDPRLHDPNWLARVYVAHGDMWIALEVGVSRATVRRQRERFGIPSTAPGRRRSDLQALPSVLQRGRLDPTEAAFIDRYREFRARKAMPHPDTIAAALRAYYRAQAAHDDSAIDSALLDMGAAAAIIHDQRQRSRKAA